MSDQVILALIGLAGAAMGAYMTYKLAQLRMVMEATHKKVNSVSLIQARRLAEAATALAELRGTPEDIANAESARKALAQSEEVQDKLIAKS